uniref:Uncharacterized protein n=1 Tax=Arundo donax TaxID=35708 RepID=A0A0A9A6H9_ARUDO
MELRRLRPSDDVRHVGHGRGQEEGDHGRP